MRKLLLKAKEVKNELIADTAHELRTPLTIMRGHIYLANKKNNLKAAKNALKAIDNEIVRLSKLLSDLVLVVSGKATAVKNVPVNIVEFIKKTLERAETLAKKKKIKIFFKTNKKNIFVMADTEHLEKLFLNLIKNAITYGKSRIDIEINDKQGKVAVKIKDDGIGIPKEDLLNVFERFYRADKSHHREGKHSGLGLSIAKRMAEIYDGKIKVKSALGKGSIFTVTLPTKKKSGKLS